MALIHQGFLNSNEARSYPLHDAATRRADNGTVLPNSFLVDAHIYLPRELGSKVYVSAASVSSHLVSLILSATESSVCGSSSGSPDVPIAELSLVKPVVPYRNYSINALEPGVAGWIAFGQGIQTETFGLQFSDVSQTMLLERAVYVENVPVVSMSKTNVQALSGLIKFRGKAGSVVASAKTMTVDGTDRTVVAIGVDPEGGTDALEALAGACGHRPGALNCNKRVITSINGVTPDCNGNIDLEFLGGVIVGETTNGVILDYPLGLHNVCTEIDPSAIPNQGSDVCGSFGQIPDPVNPSGSEGSPESSSSESGMPPWYCEDFAIAPSELSVREGIFTIDAGRWRTDPLGAVSTAVNLFANRVLGYPALVTCKIEPTATGEGHVILAYRDWNEYSDAVLVRKTAYLFVGVDLVRSRFFVAKKTDVIPNAYEVLFSWDQASLPDTEYTFSVMVESLAGNELLTIDVTWSTGAFNNTYVVTTPSLFSYGRYAGLGATSRLYYPDDSVKIWGDKTARFSGYVWFDDYGIDCNGSSSMSP